MSFCVKAAGEAPLHFSWLHDGSIVDGAEGPVLTVKGVGLADVGRYQCHVENKFGKVASLQAKLQLLLDYFQQSKRNLLQSHLVAI